MTSPDPVGSEKPLSDEALIERRTRRATVRSKRNDERNAMQGTHSAPDFAMTSADGPTDDQVEIIARGLMGICNWNGIEYDEDNVRMKARGMLTAALRQPADADSGPTPREAIRAYHGAVRRRQANEADAALSAQRAGEGEEGQVSDREAAAYWLAHAESVSVEDPAQDPVVLAAENRAHEAAMDAGFPDDFDAARKVALAVLAVAQRAGEGEAAIPTNERVDYGEPEGPSSDPMPAERRAEYQRRIKDASKRTGYDPTLHVGSSGSFPFTPSDEPVLAAFREWSREHSESGADVRAAFIGGWSAQRAGEPTPEKCEECGTLLICPACAAEPTEADIEQIRQAEREAEGP